MGQNNEQLNSKVSVKFFEMIGTWFLGLSFIMGILVLFKSLDIVYKLSLNINTVYSFSEIALELVKNTEDLKHIYTLAQIYRVFLFINIIILMCFIIYRIIQVQKIKLLKINTVVQFLAVVYSSYLVYITKDIFYALDSINNRLYSGDFSKTLYLMQRLQNIKDLKFILTVVFVLSLILTFLALIINFYESAIKNDKLIYKKINAGILSSLIIFFVVLLGIHYHVFKYANTIDVKDYYILSYQLDENDKLVPVVRTDYKKIEKRFIDPYIRSFLEMGMVYEIEKSTSNVEKGANIKVRLAYDVDTAKELDLTIKSNKFSIKNKHNVQVAKDIKDINVSTLLLELKKNDVRYLKNTAIEYDEVSGIYYGKDANGNLEIFSLQKVKLSYTPIEVKRQYEGNYNSIYQFMYLGNVFIDENKKVLSYTNMNVRESLIYDTNINEILEFIKTSKLEKY